MTPKYISQPLTLPSSDEVCVTERLADVIRQGSSTDWNNFLDFTRLNLQGQVASLSGDDLIKLQGKIEMVADFKAFFGKILDKK